MTKNPEYVTDYMTTKLITFTPEMEIKEATSILLKNKISGAPVVDHSGQLVGMLSEKDCIRLLLDGQYNQRPSGDGQVKDYMSQNIKSLTSDTTIVDAAYAFVNSPYRRFPVLQGKKLVGQISRRDVLQAIENRTPLLDHIPSSWKGRVPNP